MARPTDSIQVDLCATRRIGDECIRSGSYSSAEDVIRAGLLALEREEAAPNQWLVDLADEAIADPRPVTPAEKVFRDLRLRHSLPVSGLE